MRTDVSAKLSSHGIDYCEGDSYTYSGSAIINNNYHISVENSNATTIVSQSENIKLNISPSEIKRDLTEIIDSINSINEMQEINQQKLIEKINTIINKL